VGEQPLSFHIPLTCLTSFLYHSPSSITRTASVARFCRMRLYCAYLPQARTPATFSHAHTLPPTTQHLQHPPASNACFSLHASRRTVSFHVKFWITFVNLPFAGEHGGLINVTMCTIAATRHYCCSLACERTKPNLPVPPRSTAPSPNALLRPLLVSPFSPYISSTSQQSPPPVQHATTISSLPLLSSNATYLAAAIIHFPRLLSITRLDNVCSPPACCRLARHCSTNVLTAAPDMATWLSATGWTDAANTYHRRRLHCDTPQHALRRAAVSSAFYRLVPSTAVCAGHTPQRCVCRRALWLYWQRRCPTLPCCG